MKDSAHFRRAAAVAVGLEKSGGTPQVAYQLRSIIGKLKMKSSTIDPRKLLGFRVLLAGPEANGRDVDVKDSRLGAKIGTVKPPPPDVE